MRSLLPKPPSTTAQPAIENATQPPAKKRKSINANTGSANEKRAKPAKKSRDGPSKQLAQQPTVIAVMQRFEEWGLEATRPRDFCKLSPQNPFRKEIDQVSQILEAGRVRHSGFVHSEYAPANESDNMDFNHMASLLSRAVSDVQEQVSKTARIRTKFDAVLALLEIGTKVLQADEQVLAGLRNRGYLEVPLNVPQTLRETMACMKRREVLRVGELVEDHAGELYVLAQDLDLKVWFAGMNSVLKVLEGSEDSGYSAEDEMDTQARVLVSHFGR
ncbi:hypothetical protein EJ03DRAFT_355222 [Teratosphaeria nubilosa]|uniref:Uncharacterized protein n=1 Tax=Teratosphaeria nubilosa TaxID=161662 RepID=A0A6G1KYD8_9PEZI|nr:hypothetical protein EJ03DRAFT_355222 [Teratosphaeria nubilosa]